MWAAILGPFAVGVVRWWWPQPGLTVVVKTTYAFGEDGSTTLSPIQLGLSRDHRGASPTDEELEYASDFAPLKARADVLVVGSARAAKPVESLVAGIEVEGVLSKQVVIMTREPATEARLVGRTMFCEGGVRRLGPRPVQVDGWRQLQSPSDFDFRQFNVAPEDQQVERLPVDGRVVLSGLVGSGARCVVGLGGLEPRVSYTSSVQGEAPSHGIDVRCDTLWIHTTRRLCTLTWRGALQLDREIESGAHLLVQPRAASVAWTSEGGSAQWRNAVEREDVAPGPPPELPGPDVVVPSVGTPSSAQPSVADAPKPAWPRDRAEATEVLDQDAIRAGGPSRTPVQEPADGDVDPDEEERTATLDTSGVYLGEPSWSSGVGTELATRAGGDAGGDVNDEEDDDVPTQDRDVAALMKRLASAGLSREPTGTLVVEEALAVDVSTPKFVSANAERPSQSEDAADPSTVSESDAPPPESDEPAPVTPRAGVTLGCGLGGSALGSAVLGTGPKSADALPFAAQAASPEAGDSRADAPVRSQTMALEAIDGDLPPQTLVGEALAARMRAAAVPFSGSVPPPPPTQPGRPSPFASQTVTKARPGTSTLAMEAMNPLADANELPPGWSKPPPPGAPSPVPFALSNLPQAPPQAPQPPSVANASTPPPAVPAIVPKIDPLGRSSTKPGVVVPPDGAPPPPPRGEDPSLPLATYAAVKAALDRGKASLDVLLAERELDERSWRANERRLKVALAKESREGSNELARRLRHAVEEAAAQLEASDDGDDEVISLDDYVEIRADVEASDDVAAVLKTHELSGADWARSKRDWAARCKADPNLAAELRKKLKKARSARRG